MDINNKEIRKALIAKYLEAETSPEEEKFLSDYYICHESDEDEREFARMIRMENSYASVLSDEGKEEYDRIIMQTSSRPKRRTIRWMAWVSGIAASIALFFVLNSAPTSPLPDTVEIAQCIQQMMNLDMDDIVSVTATPVDECIWIKAELKNGTLKDFVMSHDERLGTITLLAIN